MTDPLDRPVWHALHEGWRAQAVGDAEALRLGRDYGPFAAMRGDSGGEAAHTALVGLVAADEAVWLIEPAPVPPPPGCVVRRHAVLAQRVLATPAAYPTPLPALSLGEADAAELRALAGLTRPGPFEARTHEIGDYLGIRLDGRLAAMAGERMRFGGHAEVSGVCTHPDFRGRGLARQLMAAVAARIAARGAVPFLHSYAANAAANALYERLGYRLRRTLVLTEIARA